MITTVLAPGSSLGQDQWQVWVQLVEGDPTRQHESFIVGIGPTREAAVLEALFSLGNAVADLVAPDGGE
jgi:hypothetical protein